MRLHAAAVALGIGCAVLWSSASARADILDEGRLSSYLITFSQANFGDANAFYQVTNQMVSTAPPESAAFDVSLKTDHNSLMETGTGGVSISNVVDNGGSATFNMAVDQSGSGVWTQSYNTPVQSAFNQGSGFGNTWIITDNFGTHTGLEFGGGNGGGSGLVNNGFPFAVDVLINGNWSSQGTGVGQVQLVNLNSTWTIDSDFVYNSITNQTDFHAHVDSYTGAPGGDPQLDFILHGSAPAVPEPSSLTLVLGLGAVAGVAGLRRRSRHIAS